MKLSASFFRVTLLLLVVTGCQAELDPGTREGPASGREPELSPNSVEKIANNVADWQLRHMEDFSYVRTFQDHTEQSRGWVQAAFYIGLLRWAQETDDARYWEVLREKASANQWRLGELAWHADDQAIAQVYAGLAERHNDLSLLAPTKSEFRRILANPVDHDLVFEAGGPAEGTCQRRWCWCDALFMAPPAWAAMSRLTGDPDYLNYAHREYQATIDFLYDPQEHLFYRDSRFFDQRTDNGKKVFWSRGNGWVLAGLPLFLEQLPQDDPLRSDYETLLVEMSERLVSLQKDSGFWPSSLLDTDEFPIPESSGTAFMIFGLAWGINNGLLPEEDFMPAIESGWNALESAVGPDGRMGWVQQVGNSPDQVRQEDTQLYGVGAMLLAASEVRKLARPKLERRD